jgi:hypothetical protein
MPHFLMRSALIWEQKYFPQTLRLDSSIPRRAPMRARPRQPITAATLMLIVLIIPVTSSTCTYCQPMMCLRAFIAACIMWHVGRNIPPTMGNIVAVVITVYHRAMAIR